MRKAIGVGRRRPDGARIVAIRRQKGLKQEDLASRARMSVRTLRDVERSNHPIPATTITAIARELKVSSDEIILKTPEDSQDDQKLEEFSPQIMLREVDVDGLAQLLRKANKIDWHLDHLQLVDEKMCGLLEEFGQAVNQFHRYFHDPIECEEDSDPFSLGAQLTHMKKRQVVAKLMERLAEDRISVLGVEYLHWRIRQDGIFQDGNKHYTSTRILALSVEQSGTRSRVVPIFMGSEPPKFAPKTDPPTVVFVDGVPLETDTG
jgi:transcriptional regulator with XRE-family HTH domain